MMNAATRNRSKQHSGVRRATGRDYDEWFALLDRWGAAGRPFREISGWLANEHDVSSWWAQKLIVEYEQSRGLRPPGIRPGGTFAIGTSKTVGVSVERLYQAVVDPERRGRWLPGVVMRERTSRPGRSARFDWADDRTRVSVTFAAKGDARSQLALEHELLPDPETAEKYRTFWRERLTALKAVLEGHPEQLITEQED
jgi:hypothetical protein